MFIIINRIGDNLVGSVNGTQFGVPYDVEKHNQMLALQQKAESVETVEELNKIIEDFLPLTRSDYKEMMETKSPYIVISRKTGKGYLRYGNRVSKLPVPRVLMDKMIQSAEKGINIDPLIKCWARYIRPVPGRPAYNEADATLFAKYIDAEYTNKALVEELIEKQGLSRSAALQYATTKQVAITQEGLLVCYKVSREILDKYELNEEEEVVKKSRYGKTVDPITGLVTYNKPSYAEERIFEPYVMGQRGDAFVSEGADSVEGHVIRVGCRHYLKDWKQVGMPGQKGLHCGGLNYIAGYQQEGTVTHNIFVDPMHIYGIAGLGTGNDGAMTVKQYFVHSTFESVNRNIYHSSKYAALTDKEYEELVKEAVSAHEARIEELRDIALDAAALGTATADSRGGETPGSATLAIQF